MRGSSWWAAVLCVGLSLGGCRCGSEGLRSRDKPLPQVEEPPSHPAEPVEGPDDGGVIGSGPGGLDAGSVEQPYLPPPPIVPCTGSCLAREPGPNPIPAENQLPGDPNWRNGRNANGGEVELYASTESVAAGDTVSVKVSTSVPSRVTAEVFRLGYYGGAGARKLWSGGPFEARKQAACPRDPATSRVECSWTDTFRFTIGKEWVSGLYLVKVTRPDGFKRFTPFVVRDNRAAELFYGAGFNRQQAYNTWGGESLYMDSSGTMPNGRAYHVSYNRPFAAGEGASHLLFWEYWLLRFMEQRGYDVTYGTNLDFHRFRDVLTGVGAYVHGGHDEYWPAEQRRQVDEALAGGRMSLAHFGANGAYWRTRALPDSAGNPLRTVVCYKNESSKDPQPGSTVRYRDDPSPHPESKLFGSMYDGWQLMAQSLVVKDAGHWLFEGTGLTAGAQLPGLLGYEFDRVWEGVGPESVSISMESPVLTAETVPNRSHVVDRTTPYGRLVFSAGSIFWPLGLSNDPDVRDARVERMTENVLERALSHRRPQRTLSPVTGPRPAIPAPIARWASAVEPFAGRAGRRGFADGPADAALFNGPTGLAVTPSGQVVVADTNNLRIRLIDTDEARTVRTIAGNGLPGLANGPGAEAMFRAPTGVAVGRDGSIFVADSDNHVIRRIANDPPTYTVTTYAGADRLMGHVDGPAGSARFSRPTSLALDAAGNLYVTDQAGQFVRVVLAGSRQVVTLAGSGATGFEDASVGTRASFNGPSAVAVAPSGEVYVMDSGNQRLRRISAGGSRAVTTIAGRPDNPVGFADGGGMVARFRAQAGLVLTRGGELLLSDTGNFRLRGVVPGATQAATQVYTFAGSGRVGTALGSGEAADIVAPAGLALLPDERLLVSDSYNNVVRLIRR
ncbi:hypothetical protein P2318_10970 [Myxococcaceae bacterium GXIMD 01537]